MAFTTETRIHHDRKVVGFKELAGQHRDHCLCFQDCSKFHPEDRDANCPIANALFANCVKFGVTTPVFECPEYVK